MSRKGWEIMKLGDICDFQGGSQPPKNQFIYEPKKGYVRFLQIRDFASDKNITYIPESKKNRYCNEEDILLGRYGASVGKVLVNKAGAYNVAVMKTIPNETILYKRYLYYYLNTEDFQTRLLNTASRSAQDGFSKDDIFDFPILIHPLPEQQRIVSILDEVFAAIAKAKSNTEQNLKNAKELFESYLQGVFENGKWDYVKLSEMATDISDGDHMPPPKSEFGLPFITISNINKQTHKIDFSDTFKVPHKYYDDLKPNKKPIKGDVLYTVTGSYGIPVLIEDDFQFCFQRHIGLIRPSEKLDCKLFYYWILSPQAICQANDTAKGTAQKTVSLKSLRNFSFPNIPLKAQHTIVRQLDALRAETRKLEGVYQKKIADLEELKKSILQKAFSGELGVPNVENVSSFSSQDTKVIPLHKLEGISPTDLQAGITAIAIEKHAEKSFLETLGHVKTEKIIHLAEYILGLDFERNPVKDAAGPNDFPHTKKVESRAAKAGFYTVSKKDIDGEAGYSYLAGNSLNSIISKTKNCLAEKYSVLDELLNLIAPMKTQQAEIVATVYAAWNNLLIGGKSFTDEDIVFEARENWRKEKLSIPREKFFGAVNWMKNNQILIPKGNGKIVKAK